MTDVLVLLTICSLMTGLITEAIKKTIRIPDDEYSKNILAGIVAIVVGIAVSIGYLILNHQAVTPDIIVYIVILVVLSWLCATLSYDKVKQTVLQIQRGKADE